MNSFWLKATLFLILIGGAFILIKHRPSKPQPPETQKTEQNDFIKPKLRSKIKQNEIKPPAAAAQAPQQNLFDQMEQINPHAESLYQMALAESKIAKKPMMTYKRMVDYCRQIIELYPQSPQAPKAKVLLRQMPQRYKEQYKITDEEMGLSE
jgi:hypothetical protein